MNQSVQSIIVLIFLIQIFIYVWSFIINRFRPKMAKFKLLEADQIKLHDIGIEYHNRGVNVPEQILEEPSSKLIAEAKRLELRLIFELGLILLAGSIPTIFLTTIALMY